jgi:hypothetical protein
MADFFAESIYVLAIERQQRGLFRIKFLHLHDANLTQKHKGAKKRKFNHRCPLPNDMPFAVLVGQLAGAFAKH